MKKILLSLLLCFVASCVFGAEGVPRSNSQVVMLKATSESRVRVVLVGVENYANTSPLFYCGSDMKLLRDAFLQLGASTRDVVLLTEPYDSLGNGFTNENAPTKERVCRAIEEVAAGAGPNDSIFICLSGHGVCRKIKDEKGVEKKISCFCPQDVDFNDLDATLIPLPWIYQKLGESKARFKTIVVDACRNELQSGSEKSLAGNVLKSGIEPNQNDVPENVLLLSSCDVGQKSYEDSELKHGVFTFYLANALLRRAPELLQDEVLYYSDFWTYVSSQTNEYVKNAFKKRQTPREFAPMEFHRDFPIRDATLEEKEPTFYENALGMEFLKIPSGVKKLTTKKATETRTTTMKNANPFYIGVYEVTEKEYRTILGLGKPTENEENADVRRSRFPVTGVSWDEAAAFVRRLNETTPPEGDALLGDGWRYDLPTTDDWEYAFVYDLDETNLNDVYRNFDVYAQASEKFDAPGRLAYVGLKRPVGQLFDMLGNASEWCFDLSSKRPCTKGGSYDAPKVATDQAFSPRNKFFVDKDSREPTIGFRLVIRKTSGGKPTRKDDAWKSGRLQERRDGKRQGTSDQDKRGASQGTNAPRVARATVLVDRSSVQPLRLLLKDPTEEPIGEYDELIIRPLSEYRLAKGDSSPERVYLNNDGQIYFYEIKDKSELFFDYDVATRKWTVESR